MFLDPRDSGSNNIVKHPNPNALCHSYSKLARDSGRQKFGGGAVSLGGLIIIFAALRRRRARGLSVAASVA